MQWIIETGDGITGANTYIAMTADTGATGAEGVDVWCADRGFTEWGDAGEAARNKAYFASIDYIESLAYFGQKEFGYEINNLQFPRVNLYDIKNNMEITGIPQGIKDGVAYGSWAELVYPNILAPISSQSDYLVREKIDILEFEYGKVVPTKILNRLNNYIGDFCNINGGFVKLIRD